MLSWINRIAAGTALVLATSGVAFAQGTGTVTGSVVDATSGEPLPGVQVHIPALGEGMLTNPQGRYLLPGIPVGTHTVRVQTLGYAASEQSVVVTAGGTATANFRLGEQAIEVEGIVVTALGIERSERSLGYAMQGVSEERLTETPETNLLAALKGQAAGVDVTTASSRPGGGTRITIRGESSFSGSGEPLWVIDGVPISTDTDAQYGVGGNFALNVGNAGNRGMDLDPNNVESISVLRGAAATALYGSRAAAGVIVVTTKKGVPGQPARFSLSTRYETQKPLFAGKQTNYTAGWIYDGVPTFCNARTATNGGWCESAFQGSSPQTYWNWGPHKDSLSAEVLAHEGGYVRMVDPRSDYYRDGQLQETSLNATGGIGAGGSYNLGTSFLGHSGLNPGDELDRLNLSANVTLPLTDRLTSNTMIQYSNSVNEWKNEGYEGAEGVLVRDFAPNADVREAWICDGQRVQTDVCGDDNPVMYGSNSPHFAWRAENEFRESSTARWIASQMFRYDILSNLSIQNRIGMDTYNDQRSQVVGERPWRTANQQSSGGAMQGRYRRLQINDDLILNLSGTRLTDAITVSGLLGANLNMQEYDNLTGTANDIVIPGFYNLDNFENQNLSETMERKERLVGVYSQVTTDYRDWAFLNLTARNDWSSTLPLEANSFFYPSANLAVVFTDALGIQSRWLEYGKARVSVAKVGAPAPPYRLRTTYSQSGALDWPYKGQLGYQQSTSLGNPALRPESTTEYEYGVELRGLQGRARVDFSYYDKRSYDQIFSVPASAASGFNSITRNAGDLRNKGIELSLQTVPVQTERFRWDMTINFARNRSSVLELAPGVESIALAGYSWPQIRIMEGEPYGVIWGYGYERDAQGRPMIYGESAANDGDARAPISGQPTTPGYPIFDDELKVIGNMQADWTGSLYNSVRLGPFNLAGMITTRQGGDILNFDLNYTINNGTSSFTSERMGEHVYDGVNADTGEPNERVVIKDRAFFSDYGAYNHHENQVEDGSFVRLQSLSLGYTVPQSLVDRIGAESLQLYVQGNNLHLWTDFSYGDPAGSSYGSSNAGGSAFRMFVPPSTRSYSIGLRTNF